MTHAVPLFLFSQTPHHRNTMHALSFFSPLLLLPLATAATWRPSSDSPDLFYRPGTISIIPQDNRTVFLEAFRAAREEIRVEICVLEDPIILQGLQAALARGVSVRALVDNGKYQSNSDEQANLETYLTDNGGILHLSNPIFPRSFPKVILIDEKAVLVGSSCLDSTTFEEYRDYVYVSNRRRLIKDLAALFENDWSYSRPPQLNNTYPPVNPTPPTKDKTLMVSPVNAADRYVSFLQKAKRTLDVTSEEWGNPTLQSQLVAAVTERGVRVRVLAPLLVNGASTSHQAMQNQSLAMLQAQGIQVHVTMDPQSAQTPYMHARSAVRDGQTLFLGSLSYSYNSSTFNREVGLVITGKEAVGRVEDQFEMDWLNASTPLSAVLA